MDGLILVDKPQDFTSHDIVAFVRKKAGQRKVGHCGSLDPLATGLLLISLGKATRLFPFLSKMDKLYRGHIRLGFSTDTFDAAGRPTSPESDLYPDPDRLNEAMAKFCGDIEQRPPAYSAKKYKGKPLYVYARKNRTLKLRPQKVHVRSFRLITFEPPELEFEVECSSGTYIRSIAHDLGQVLGCGAHLSSLNRLRVGHYSLDESLTLETLRTISSPAALTDSLIPMERLLPECPRIVVNDEEAIPVKNGNPLSKSENLRIFPPEIQSPERSSTSALYRIISDSGRFLSLARESADGTSYLPFLVVDSDTTSK